MFGGGVEAIAFFSCLPMYLFSCSGFRFWTLIFELELNQMVGVTDPEHICWLLNFSGLQPRWEYYSL